MATAVKGEMEAVGGWGGVQLELWELILGARQHDTQQEQPDSQSHTV